MTQNVTANVRILDTEYRVSCAPGEEQELKDAARHLDDEMRKIRGSGKVVGLDRIAVMAALNMAHEMLQARAGKGGDDGESQARVRGLIERLDKTLESHRQLELQ